MEHTLTVIKTLGEKINNLECELSEQKENYESRLHHLRQTHKDVYEQLNNEIENLRKKLAESEKMCEALEIGSGQA